MIIDQVSAMKSLLKIFLLQIGLKIVTVIAPYPKNSQYNYNFDLESSFPASRGKTTDEMINNLSSMADNKNQPKPHRTNKESELINYLLENYNPNARPVLDFNKPVTVNFSLSLRQIDEMNIKDQILRTGLWINHLWKDEFLVWDPNEWDGVQDFRLPIDQIWKPDILLYNSVGENFDPSYPTLAKISYDGTVNWLPPAMVTTSCQVNVRYFPFDRQSCPFIFGPWTHDISRIDLRLISNQADMSEFTESNVWSNVEFSGYREELKFESTPNDPAYVKITFWMQMRRNHRYGIMNFIMPCLVVTIMSLMVFILPPDAGEKVGLAITVLLTLVVFLQTLGEATPATSDTAAPPVISVFFMITMLIVTASLVTTVQVLNMHHRDVGLEGKFMSPFFRCLFLKVLPKFLSMKEFDGDGIDELTWFGPKLENADQDKKSSHEYRDRGDDNLLKVIACRIEKG